MNRLIPILVSKKKALYTAQVLFFPNIKASDKTEWKARRKLEKDVHAKVEDYVKNDATDALNQFLFAPVCRIENFNIQTEYRSRTINIWLPIVYWSEGENHYIYCPFLEQFRYVHKDEASVETVEYYFQYWLRKVNRNATKESVSRMTDVLNENFSEKQSYTIRLINVLFHEKLDMRWYRNGVKAKIQPPPKVPRTSKSALPKKAKKELIYRRVNHILKDVEGFDEYEFFEEPCKDLRDVGESIDYNPETYEELAFLEDYTFVNPPANDALCDFYERLYFALTDKKHRKGVLVVGPEMTGRSYAIETVLQTIQRNVNYRVNEDNILVSRNRKHYYKVWKLSGSGIISGMSVVGKWEARTDAIFSFAANNDLILYFESLIGLTEAGTDEMSSFSVADALLSYMKEKKVRVVSKISPTQLVKLRERNRSFVNQFEILTMPALKPEELLRIYIRKIQDWRRIDDDDRSPFENIPFISHLVEWTNPDAGAPGSVCKWLDKISDRPSSSVQDRLLSQIGANFPLLKNELSPNYEEIHESLSKQVIGQEEAVDALTNWTLKFQGLLSDPGRPAASMLFLGPTGVGKTESAKAVARFLYNDDSHFLRFDCNELNSAYAVSQLIGSARHEGTLTNAVRLEPFSVVLFDEIEKAHPAFHDLLLQILGEGRLTDGKGRTTSFKNCFIILTSNLGANQTGRFTGFGDIYQNDRDIYFKAVERYFRPEFVNRLDIVVPFNRLGYSELEIIARKYVNQIRSREGFQKRKALLSISPSALDWLVQQGHDPKYGARQTQRSLERILVEPLSAFFAQTSWDTISVIDVGCENDKLTYAVSSLVTEKPQGTNISRYSLNCLTYDDFQTFYNAFLDMKKRILGLFPQKDYEEKAFNLKDMDDVSLLRFRVKEELDRIDRQEFVADSSESDNYGYDEFASQSAFRELSKVYDKLNSYVFLDEVPRGGRYRDIKIPVIKRLSPHEWQLLLDSESGYYPDFSAKLAEVEYIHMPYYDALKRCARLNQLFKSGFPQQEDALILFFSTGGFDYDERFGSSNDWDMKDSEFFTDKDLEDPVICEIAPMIGRDLCSFHTNKVMYKSTRHGMMKYLHVRGLHAYQTLSKKMTGVYVIFDDGILTRADSVVVLNLDSERQTPEECIEEFLDSRPIVWKNLRFMCMCRYVYVDYYEEGDYEDYFEIPPEFQQAFSKIGINIENNSDE
ncbi:MAG: ATP-dependent Clp protease ATP-binding subunit [Thermoguttaceae bacterium]|nr:ATP-dependent Clp protease ATP-binding subunit [Thermoguttaceae bacterium]